MKQKYIKNKFFFFFDLIHFDFYLQQIDEQASPKAKNIVNPTPTATVNVDELLAEVIIIVYCNYFFV